MLSWLTAVTVTPLLGVMYLKPESSSEDAGDPYESGFYLSFKALLRRCIRFRWVTLSIVGAAFSLSIWGFQFVDQSFFPQSTRPQFTLDFWLPQGTHIEETQRQVESVERYLLEQEEITHVTTLLGKGGLRFLLTYTPEKLNSSYAQLLVDVEDYRVINDLSSPG
jgi:multidrug efflux pump subunit AcrB